MVKMRIAVPALTLLLGSSIAIAQPQVQGFPLNISTVGAFSAGQPMISCSIVFGATVLAVLAEDFGSGANMRLRGGILQADGSLGSVVTNNNWGTLPQDQRDLLAALLRVPNQPSDAALVVAVQSSQSGLIPICFETDDEQGRSGRANIQINDLVLIANLPRSRSALPGGDADEAVMVPYGQE